MVETSRTINLPLYLEVMGHLPGVTSSDIAQARQALTSAFGNFLSSVTFERGVRFGDGDISVSQDWTGDDGRSYSTTLHLLENGGLVNYDINFRASLPSSLGRYFFAGIFGTDELSGSVRPVDTSSIISGRWNLSFDPQQEASLSNYAPELMEGVRLFYECAEDERSVSSCQNSDGVTIITAVREQFESDRAAHENAVRENAERQRIAQEQAAEQARQTQIDDYQQRSEQAWRDAEQLREASRGWADGDPDDIQEIMDRYEIYRYYAGSSDDLENARVRYEKSREMMRAIANDGGGWPQFRERFCNAQSVTEGHGSCAGSSYDYGTTIYNCSYGVTKHTSWNHRPSGGCSNR